MKRLFHPGGVCRIERRGRGALGSPVEVAARSRVAAPPRSRVGAALRSRVGAMLGTAVLAAVLLVGCQQPKPPKPRGPENVKTMTVVRQTVVDGLELPGVVVPNEVVNVAAEVAGRIEAVLPEEGQEVKKGEVIVKLNTDLLKPECDRAKAQSEFDRAEHERMIQLAKSGGATSTQVEQARVLAAISQAGYALAKANLERATIAAPTSGRLDSLPKKAGEYVSAGDVLAVIVDLAVAKVVVDVPERDVRYVQTGKQITDMAAGVAGEEKISGVVTYVSDRADAQSRTTRVEISVKNNPRRLWSGQIVMVRLTRDVLEGAIMIPLDAVIPLENGKAVYVVEGGKAQPRTVTLGMLKGYSVRVVSGLEAGDRLIVSGHRYVGPGQAVAVVESDGKAPAAGTWARAEK